MPLQQSERDIEPRLEGVQIAVVDADQRGLQFERAIEFDGIMHFDEHGHAEVRRDRRQFLHAPRVQRSDDQQDAIGAHRARLVHLIRVEHEIFAQDGQAAGSACAPQIIGAALEKLLIGQNRQASRAMPGIARGDGGRIEIFAQDAAARARLLDFGYHRRLAHRNFRAQGAREVARFGHGRGGDSHGRQRTLRFGRRDLFGLDGEYALQDVRHGSGRLHHWPGNTVQAPPCVKCAR